MGLIERIRDLARLWIQGVGSIATVSDEYDKLLALVGADEAARIELARVRSVILNVPYASETDWSIY